MSDQINFVCGCTDDEDRKVVKITENRIVLRSQHIYDVYILLSKSETTMEVEHDISFHSLENTPYTNQQHITQLCTGELYGTAD